MITLLTGLPGNGKTLFALWLIKQKAEKEKREVYYHNITDLTLPWTVFDPITWMDLPHGCIIVIDEAQDVFPKKPNGATLPDYYTELAKHRHRGFDIYLITQHPTLIDNFVRRLVGQHYHAVRKFGLSRSTIYEWSACNPAPELPASQKSAIPLKWSYPKEVYTYYKSAEVHTVKRSVPVKIFLVIFAVAALLIAGYYFMSMLQGRGSSEKPTAVNAVQGVQPGGSLVAALGGSAAAKPLFDARADALNFVQQATPRIDGLPHTAPKYDEHTKPTHVPVPAACIQHGKVGEQCRCYSQQGTAMDVAFNMCISFARNGFFQEFDPDGQRPLPMAPAAPVMLADARDSGSAVSVIVDSTPVASPAKYPIAK